MLGDIGHSKPTKVLPILALLVFLLGLSFSLLLTAIVKDEDKQINAQLPRQEVLIQTAGN